jgi:hypothetical protein
MKGKVTLLAGIGIGYVVGTRAGRQQYEKIKGQAKNVWSNPKVQDAASRAQSFAAEKAPEVQHKMTETASKVSHAAAEKVHRGQGSEGMATTGPTGASPTSSTSSPTSSPTGSPAG